MIKTVEEWLYELPEPYKTKALRHHSFYNRLGNSDCLSNALVLAFKWTSTNEGGDYWREVHTMCMEGKLKAVKPIKTKSIKYITKKTRQSPIIEIKPSKVIEIVMYRPFEERKKQIDKLNNN